MSTGNPFWESSQQYPLQDLPYVMEEVWRACLREGPAPDLIYCKPEFYEKYRWCIRSAMLVWINRKKGRKSRRFNRRRLAHISKGNNR